MWMAIYMGVCMVQICEFNEDGKLHVPPMYKSIPTEKLFLFWSFSLSCSKVPNSHVEPGVGQPDSGLIKPYVPDDHVTGIASSISIEINLFKCIALTYSFYFNIHVLLTRLVDQSLIMYTFL